MAELTQFGQRGGRLRVCRRPHRPDQEGLRPGAFQPGEHQRRGTPVERQPQAGRGQFRAEGGGAGPQVQAAEPATPGPDHRQAGPELSKRRPWPPFPLGKLGPGQPPQQPSRQRLRRPMVRPGGEPLPSLCQVPGRDQRPGREQFGQVRVVIQPAAAQPSRHPSGLRGDPARRASAG